MQTIWKRIHAWLDANAPKGYGKLRPGASDAAIQTAEKAMGLKFPADLKASCRVHDGQRNEPGLIGGEGWCLLPLKEMVKTWRRWSSHDERFASCVPVAWGGGGDYIFIDLNPTAKKRGSVIVQRSDMDEPDPVASSFRSWLEGFADQLDDDEFAYSDEDGCIMYADELD